jgi:DNA-binding winged helix-turn-helix (wHTH) protein/predicted ATPase/energy-coupling factor transporter ATP-binding protein EcfA2
MRTVKPARYLHFSVFCFDRVEEQLWQGTQAIPLRRKPLALLRHLMEHAGEVVTKDALLDAVWHDVHVGEEVLTVHMREIRKALGDEAHAPRFIETVHGRGYRFLPAVTTQPIPSSMFKVPSFPPPPSGNITKVPSSFQPGTWNLKPETFLVGRDRELTYLHQWLAKALHGERQMVFVTGEPGIGKTTLVEAFLAGIGQQATGNREQRREKTRIKTDPQSPFPVPWIGQGQCIEQYGAGEAYMPIFAALSRLCREPGGERLIALLHQYAPMWLVQMPTLLQAAELEALQRKIQGATYERMLREMVEAVNVLTAERPLVLWLEDLHWSDASTLELVALLARRREPARLLVIGTYRPVDVLVREHPLRTVKQELQLHGLCAELPLSLLSETQVAEYLTARLLIPSPALVGKSQGEGISSAVLQQLTHFLYYRTDGNPLFMVTAIEDLIEQQILVHRDGQWVLHSDLTASETRVPGNLQQMIERQIERLGPEDRGILEGASVAGMEFSTVVVAASVGTEVEVVEERCAELARQAHFIRASGVNNWPDGTAATRYEFLHAFYQEVLYKRIPAERRQRLHQRIGERKEQAYGDRVREIAGELAVHFEQGRDHRRAAQYLQQAGENAVRRSAHQEAIRLFTRSLESLKVLPDVFERAQQELQLQYALGAELIVTKGAAAPEVERVYTRVHALCHQLGETPYLFWMQLRLWNRASRQGESRTRYEHVEQLLSFPQKGRDLLSRLPTALTQGVTLCFLGELIPAREQLEEGIALYVPQEHRSAFHGIACLVHAAQVLWYLGYPEQALQRSNEALALTQEVVHPYSRAFVRHWAAGLHCMRGELRAVHTHAEALLSLSSQQGLQEWVAMGVLWRGWALAQQGKGAEGMAQMRQALATRRALGAELWWTYYLALMAQACRETGQVEKGLSLLAEALTTRARTGECFYEAELYRLKGELLLAQAREQATGNGQQSRVTDP